MSYTMSTYVGLLHMITFMWYTMLTYVWVSTYDNIDVVWAIYVNHMLYINVTLKKCYIYVVHFLVGPTARMSRNDSHITDGQHQGEQDQRAEASPGGIRSNQADRDPRLREALSSSGRRM